MPSDRLTIGFAYDSPVDESTATAGSVSCEYEDSKTIDWMYGCLSELGDVVRLPWGSRFIQGLLEAHPDVIFNITEASGGRNRESLVPAVAEALEIPCTGSDAVSLGLSLDKHISKNIALHEGVPAPPSIKIDSLSALDKKLDDIARMGFPLIVKPVTGGSSQGIRDTAKVESVASLKNEIGWVLENCEDSALVEKFVAGREFCVGLLEKDTLICLPVAELRIDGGDPDSFYSYDLKSTHRKQVICPADIPVETVRLMEEYSVKMYHALGCRDLARIDFRLGRDGVPYFLEINPLPGLSPYYSVYTRQAEAGGIKPEEVIEILINNALARGKGI